MVGRHVIMSVAVYDSYNLEDVVAMSRKDYVVLAEALGKAMATAERVDDRREQSCVLGWAYAVDEVVLALVGGNPRFSTSIFEAAIWKARDVEAQRYAEWEQSKAG